MHIFKCRIGCYILCVGEVTVIAFGLMYYCVEEQCNTIFLSCTRTLGGNESIDLDFIVVLETLYSIVGEIDKI